MAGNDAGPLIDLLHMGVPGAIACYLTDAEGPAIIDPGPSTTLDRLVDELWVRGVGPNDLRHVFLTHVHLDHAGASGHVARIYPRAVVHVHVDGARHMTAPDRLVASTRRTFGEAHDELWGDVIPVPSRRVRAVDPAEHGRSAKVVGRLRALSTPGHIAHHLAYLDEGDGTLYAGDAMGIIISGGPTHVPTPPPAIDPRAWESTLAELGEVAPECFAPTHFGVHDDFEARRTDLLARLEALETRVRRALQDGDEEDAGRYQEEVVAEQVLGGTADPVAIERYFTTFPASTDWEGMAFYLRRNP